MEISNAYSKALELEGLLMLLKSENTDNFKIDLIFTRLFEKMDEINDDLTAIRRQYKLELLHAAEQHVKENSRIVPVPEPAADLPVIEDKTSEYINIDDNTITRNCPADSDSPEPAVQEPECACGNDGLMTDDAVADSALFEEEEDADMASLDNGNADTVGAASLPQECSEEGLPEHAGAVVSEATVEPEAPVNIVIEDMGVDVNRSAFALSSRGDIRKMFTLNDNYKFRRQLFSNSQESYADTLLKVEKMNSTFEAEDYFYNKLKWDKENTDVKDFMSVISAYFLGK